MLSIIRTAVLDFLLFLLLCVPLGNTRAADPEPPLLLEQRIPLTDVSGRIDHMTVDLRRQRLFVAESGNGTIDIIDLAMGKAIHRIDGLREPQGIAYAAKADMLAVASSPLVAARVWMTASRTAHRVITADGKRWVLRLPILIQVSPACPACRPMCESRCRRPYQRMLQWSMQAPVRSRFLAGLPVAWRRRAVLYSMRQIKLDWRSLNGLTEAEEAVHEVGAAHAPVCIRHSFRRLAE
jgi:hypothetical protein